MKKIIIFFTILSLTGGMLLADEGMYPVTMMDQVDLKEKGFEISLEDIFSPGKTSLFDAIVKVNGCTGSFVSGDGLIITNHHCAFRAANLASDAGHDYIRDGFLAESREMEIPARGYTVRITRSYSDVSAEVTDGLEKIEDAYERNKVLADRIKAIVARAEKENPGMRAEVSEMFKGRQYILFIYTYLRDIRLVYVPPRSIGEFGGDIDNYEWPRHTGDFSFLRAYVAPDGQPADFSPENVPYHPRKHLQVNPGGVNDGDFVFILGFPGRTFRHLSSYFLEYEQRFNLPARVEWYQWLIATMEEAGREDRSVALKHLSRIKSLANLDKRYSGRLLGLRRLRLVAKRQAEEEKMRRLDPRVASVLDKLGDIYRQRREEGYLTFWLSRLRSDVYAFSFADRIIGVERNRAKKDMERESPYMDRNWPRTLRYTMIAADNFYLPVDRAILSEILTRLLSLPAAGEKPALRQLAGMVEEAGSPENFARQLYRQTRITDKTQLKKWLQASPEEIEKLKDSFIELRRALEEAYEELKEESRRTNGQLALLQPRYTEARMKFMKGSFIPDANGTLRLTFGHIRGYHPRDAVYNSPVTSLTGIVEKNTGRPPFNAPDALMQNIKEKNYGRFYNKAVDSVPVCILYDLDTTGGNSGSPVMDSGGRLIGVNFDRAFEATINDYAYSERYSRSIAVDIRYVLWVVKYIAGADELLREMGVGE